MLIEHVDKIVGLRRNLVLEDSRFPSELTAAFTNMERAGNPWGQPKTTRTDWTKGLPFEVPTVAELAAADRLGEIEVLYWVGCAAAFDERNRRVARAFATCLDRAGIRFAILGQEESCTGDPARRMGNDYVWQLLASENVATLDRYGLRASSPPVRTASTRSATSTASSAAATRWSTTRSTSSACSPTAGSGRSTRMRPATPRPGR